MIRASIGRRTSDGTTATAAFELIAPSDKTVILREMTVSLAAATASIYALGRPAAKGITPTTPVALLFESGSFKPPATTTALAWGTGPTVPAQFYRRIGFPAVIGSFITWTFSGGLALGPGETLVLWNGAANGLADVTVVCDETYS